VGEGPRTQSGPQGARKEQLWTVTCVRDGAIEQAELSVPFAPVLGDTLINVDLVVVVTAVGQNPVPVPATWVGRKIGVKRGQALVGRGRVRFTAGPAA